MKSPNAIIAELTKIYEQAVSALRADVAAYAASGTPPPPERRRDGSWCYPELRLHYAGRENRPDVTRAYGRLSRGGTYSCTITRPALFADYLTEQLGLLAADYDIRVEVDSSRQEI